MLSPSNASGERDGQVALKAALLLLAVALGGLEYFIPRMPLFPWLKPGLANIVTVAWLVQFGTVEALLFSLLRIWITGFYFGFSFMSLLLAFSGAVMATLAMGVLWRVFGRSGLVGLVGLGLAGAFAHNAGQLAAAYIILARNTLLVYQLPFMAAASLVSGGIVGLLSVSLVGAVAESTPAVAIRPVLPQSCCRGRHVALCSVLLAWSVAVMFTNSWAVLATSALTATVIAQRAVRGSVGVLLAPVRSSWLLLLAVAAFHALFSYGTRIEGIPLITREGLREAGMQTLRLWTWLHLSSALKRARFDAVFMQALGALFASGRETLSAGIIALEYFPETLAWGRRSAGPWLRRLARSPRESCRTFAADLYEELLAEVLPRTGGGPTVG